MAGARPKSGVEIKGSNAESFRIYDYTKSDPLIELSDFESWKEEIKRLAPNKLIEKSKRYKCSLKSLGNYGKPFVHLNFFHTFHVLNLIDPTDYRHFGEISLEKDQSGIFFQFAREKEIVMKKRKGKTRLNVSDFKTHEPEHFEGSIVNNLVDLKELLEEYENLSSVYNAVTSNCRLYTKNVNKGIVKNSKHLEFHLPGSSKTFRLDDPEILRCVEDFYPGWKNKDNVQLIPEIQDLFSAETLLLKSVKYDEESLSRLQKFDVAKQKVANAFVDASKRLKKGRKAILSNVSKVVHENALKLTGKVPTSKIELLSKYWNAELELVLVADEIGIVVVSFFDVDEEPTEDDEGTTPPYLEFKLNDRKNDLLRQLGGFSETAKCLNAINVVIGKENSKDLNLVDLETGFRLTVFLDPDSQELDGVFDGCFAKIQTASKTAGQKDKLRTVAAKLIFLQNFESDDVNVHKKMKTQEFGLPGLCMWTSEQLKIIQEARNDFGQEILPLVSVTGCSGSGKTMVMLTVVREFLKSKIEGKVFVRILHDLIQLKSEIEKLLMEDGKLDERIYIGHDPPENMDDFRIVLFDEFDVGLEGEILDQEKPIFKKITDQAIFIFSSNKLVDDHMERGLASAGFTRKVKLFRLTGSLRSSSSITKLIAEFHNCNVILPSQNVESSPAISWEKTPPIIETIDDGSNDRAELTTAFLTAIDRIDEDDVDVICLMHHSLKRKLKRACDQANLGKKKIRFLDEASVLGCEFYCLFVVIDAATYLSNYIEVSQAMTRAMSSLRILVNRSKERITIDGRPCVDKKSLYRGNLLEEVDAIIQLAKENEESVAFYDVWGILPADFKEARAEHFYLQFGRDNRHMRTEFSNGKSLVVEIQENGSTCSTILDAPYLFLWVLPEIDERIKEFSDIFYEYVRDDVIKFFVNRETGEK